MTVTTGVHSLGETSLEVSIVGDAGRLSLGQKRFSYGLEGDSNIFIQPLDFIEVEVNRNFISEVGSYVRSVVLSNHLGDVFELPFSNGGHIVEPGMRVRVNVTPPLEALHDSAHKPLTADSFLAEVRKIKTEQDMVAMQNSLPKTRKLHFRRREIDVK